LAQDWLNDSTGWVGTFVQDPPNDGMFKWEGVFALPNANFIASDSNLTLGSTVTYTNLTGSATSYAWTFDGGSPGTFTGKTPPPITYNSPGTFNTRLIATNSFGPDTLLKTGYIHVGGVGINEVPYASVTIYPNPAHGMLKVKTSDNVEAVQLFNLVGQVVVDQTMDSKEFSLNIEGLNPGVYTLKLTIGEKPYIRKIVVN
ncbi:MAG TPA: T9SS type A sorting domain-containing protein, partial [Bacteroidales bacterium]|nr:T9SS type A sorting domain-containing protein [Bacteroidales bacterium]